MSVDSANRPASSSSHWVAWTLSLAAVPVLYLLGVGALCYQHGRGWSKPPYPAWYEPFFRPYQWARRIPGCNKPLETYTNWWIQLGSRHYMAEKGATKSAK